MLQRVEPAGTICPRHLPAPPRERRNKGFTLVELLVVIAIIGVLHVLIVPAFPFLRDAGQRLARQNVPLAGDVLQFVDDAEDALERFAIELEPVTNGGDPTIGGLEYLAPLCVTLNQADDLHLKVEAARRMGPQRNRVQRDLATLDESLGKIIAGRDRIRYLIRKDFPDVRCP